MWFWILAFVACNLCTCSSLSLNQDSQYLLATTVFYILILGQNVAQTRLNMYWVHEFRSLSIKISWETHIRDSENCTHGAFGLSKWQSHRPLRLTKNRETETGERKLKRLFILLFLPCLLRLEAPGVNDTIFEVYIVLCWYGLRSGFWSLMASLLCLKV